MMRSPPDFGVAPLALPARECSRSSRRGGTRTDEIRQRFRACAEESLPALDCALPFLLNIVNTVGEYILGQAVVSTGMPSSPRIPASTREASSVRFTASIFHYEYSHHHHSGVYRLAHRGKLGMRGVLLALPVVALGAYGLASVGRIVGVALCEDCREQY
jgi:hypothetical protein